MHKQAINRASIFKWSSTPYSYHGSSTVGILNPYFEWAKRGWVANHMDFEWDQKSHPFEIQTNGFNFVKNHLKSEQKCPDSELVGLQLQPQLKPDHLKSDLQKARILNFLGFQIVGFQNPLYLTLTNQTHLPFEYHQYSGDLNSQHLNYGHI